MHKPIQIVDKSGKFAGLVKSPKDALLKQQIRLVSRVIISNENGHYLLQKRAEGMFIYPGFWDSSAAGHVDEGETPEEAAYRELLEEIGIKNINLQEIGRFYSEMTEVNGYTSKIYSHIFHGEYNNSLTELILDPAEVSEVKWFSRSDILSMIRNEDVVTHGVKLIFDEAL